MTTLESQRQFFAEEIAALANLETPGPRQTADTDPSHAYHSDPKVGPTADPNQRRPMTSEGTASSAASTGK
jgi:hypothetical protein